MYNVISNNNSRSAAEYEVFKAAKSYMFAITDRIFRDNIFDYRTCADCPDRRRLRGKAEHEGAV